MEKILNNNSKISKRQTPTIILLAASLCLLTSACEDFLETPPPKNQLVSSNVYSSDPAAAIRGLFASIMNESPLGGTNPIQNIHTFAGLSADELENYANTSFGANQFFENALDPASIPFTLWQNPYKYIYYANSILEGLPASEDVITNIEIQQFEGEAKFIRALFHLYLVCFWGETPIVTSTNYRTNSSAQRRPREEVYAQIIADLQDAQRLLATDNKFSNNEKVRPNSQAATALLARVYLYAEDWINAELKSSRVIEDERYRLMNTAEMDVVFAANSPEAILQLIPVVPGFNTIEGRFFILLAAPSNVAVTSHLLNAFEPGDNRRENWIASIGVGESTYYYPSKYKIQSGSTLEEYSMVLRLAEQYLIRAEARTKQGNIIGGKADLNTIRNRAGLPNTTADTQDALLKAILRERQVELFTEWGHRWIDLNRSGKASAVLGEIKAGWRPEASLFPIPQQQLDVHPGLWQNPGY